jgi:hypothetical protein
VTVPMRAPSSRMSPPGNVTSSVASAAPIAG